MNFLHSAFLYGTLLVAIPIALHLIMRQKPRWFEFPALRFVQRKHEVNRRRMRLQHWILLVLRMLVIALLAMALAGPSLTFSDGGVFGSQEEPVAAVLVFDASPRMQYRHDNKTRLETARDMGLWLLAQLPQQSEIAVLDTRSAHEGFLANAGAAEDRMKRLETITNSHPLVAAVDEAILLAGRSELARKEVYVFTDLSQAAWPPDSSAAAQLQDRIAAASDMGVFLIDVGVENPRNFGLGRVVPLPEILSEKSPLRLETTLSCVGEGGERTVELFLIDREGRREKRGQQTVSVEPDQSAPVVFSVTGLEKGTHQGIVRLLEQDNLPADDVRYFTVDVKQAWHILVAAPEPAAYYAKFLTQAIAPQRYRRSGRARYQCDVITLEELSDWRLGAYSAVCLVDPSPLKPKTPEAPGVWRRLTEYAAAGNGVAIFLGHNASPAVEFNAGGADELLPGRLATVVRRRNDDPLALAPRKNHPHPVLASFRGRQESVPWNLFPIFRYWQLEDPSGTMVPMTNGSPAILERPVGKGRVLMMTTPISDRAMQTGRDPWNLLAISEAVPTFLLLNDMMAYLVGSGNQRLNYAAGAADNVELYLEIDEIYDRYAVTLPEQAPDGTDIPPVSPDRQRQTVTVSGADWIGSYRVEAGGTGGLRRGFSVNLDPRQTQLRRTTPEQLDELFESGRYHLARAKEDLSAVVRRGRVGRNLFPLVMMLLAVVLGAEQVLANKFYRDR